MAKAKPLDPSKLTQAGIRTAYKDAIRVEAKITFDEMKKIVQAAFKDKKFSSPELEDLDRILRRATLSDKAREYLTSEVNRQVDKVGGTVKYLSGKDLSEALTALEGYTHRIRFKDGKHGLEYTPTDYARIASFVRDGVYLVADQTAAGAYGEHSRWYGTITYPKSRSSLHKLQKYSVVIHEATHAIQDYRNLKTSVLHLEVAAHLAETLFLLGEKAERQLAFGSDTTLLEFRELAELVAADTAKKAGKGIEKYGKAYDRAVAAIRANYTDHAEVRDFADDSFKP